MSFRQFTTLAFSRMQFVTVLFFFLLVPSAVFSQIIAAGNYYSLVLCNDGTVRAFGSNFSGQLGDSTFDSRNTGVLVKGLSDVIAISGEGNHSIALKSDSTVWGWGLNYNGQVGDSSNDNKNLPVKVFGLSSIVAIAAGEYHSLALKSDGTVWSWGWGIYGQLGNGYGASNIPIKIDSISGVIAIAAGSFHSLALKSDGTVWAWGSNGNGELGSANTSPADYPQPVVELSNVKSIFGSANNSYAIKNDGTLWVWGSNTYFQLGNNTEALSTYPRQVSELSGITTFTGGFQHSLALKNDGTVWTWGNNSAGQLGNGAIDSSSSYVYQPTMVQGLSGVIALTGGGTHTLAVKNDGSVWAWGYNLYGQLGNGTNTEFYTLPVQVSGTWQALTGISTQDTRPVGFELAQNYPNPFNPSTTLRYTLRERSTIQLSVYTILGQEISQVVNRTSEAGSYEFLFDASQLSSGVYFYRIEAASVSDPSNLFVETKKMILMR